MAAALPPVDMVVPAGPYTPDSRIMVDANDDIVTGLSFLNWQPLPSTGMRMV